MFRDGDKSAHPPLIEIDFSNFKWNIDEMDTNK